jgi:hypothetical protein
MKTFTELAGTEFTLVKGRDNNWYLGGAAGEAQAQQIDAMIVAEKSISEAIQRFLSANEHSNSDIAYAVYLVISAKSYKVDFTLNDHQTKIFEEIGDLRRVLSLRSSEIVNRMVHEYGQKSLRHWLLVMRNLTS